MRLVVSPQLRRAASAAALACASFSMPVLAQDLGVTEQAILDGQLTSPTELRATVAIVDLNEKYAFCTGTLVAPDVVLTAAHCGLVIDESGVVTGERAPETIGVVAGLTDVSRIVENEHLYRAADVIEHPDFAEDPPEDPALLFGNMHDLGIIVLERPVTTMQPVPILGSQRAQASLRAGRQLVIEGFGSTDTSGLGGGGQLRSATVPMVRLGDDEFIAGGSGTADTCPGDSGGPVYLDSAIGLALVGVTSRAIAGASQPCGEGGIYTLAPAYLEFLAQVSPSAITTLGPNQVEAPPAVEDEADTPVLTTPNAPPPAQAGCQAGALPLHIPAVAMVLWLMALMLRRRGR